MLHSKVKVQPGSKDEVLKACGEGNAKLLISRVAYLKELWLVKGKKLGDCDEVRLMGKVLFASLTPMHAAIIVDNLDYFKSNFQGTAEIDEKLLRVACLCGAENIANFLLGRCDNPLYKYDFILTHISASPNKEWAEAVARQMNDKHMEMPVEVDLYSDQSTAQSIANIFNSNHRGRLTFKM